MKQLIFELKLLNMFFAILYWTDIPRPSFIMVIIHSVHDKITVSISEDGYGKMCEREGNLERTIRQRDKGNACINMHNVNI